jgi:hypothetical protein
MAWEDFRSRTIGLWLFIVWAVLLLIFQDLLPLDHLLINATLLLVQIGVMALYGLWKNKGGRVGLGALIGTGDLLFMALSVFYFHPLDFQLTLITALILSLVYGLVSKAKTQPLAGVYALVMTVAIWLQHYGVHFFQVEYLDL